MSERETVIARVGSLDDKRCAEQGAVVILFSLPQNHRQLKELISGLGGDVEVSEDGVSIHGQGDDK